MRHASSPQMTLGENPSMPERIMRPLFAVLVPAGLKIVPLLTLEAAWAWVISQFAGLESITVALFCVQAAAIISTGLVHSRKSDEMRREGRNIVHMWLCLIVVMSADHGKLLPGVSLYTGAASVLFCKEALLVLKNASESGINTPWLTKIFESLRAKGEAPTVIASRDPLAIAAWDQLQKQPAPIAPTVAESDITKHE